VTNTETSDLVTFMLLLRTT